MEADENRKKTMIEKMTAVYSYVTRQKNDGRNTLLPSDMEQSLLSPYFMNCSLDPNHSQSELLLWLSVWRTGFELCEQFKRIPEWKLKHLFNVLKNYIQSSNKYVVYETKMVYVAALQKLKLQFVIEDIATNLQTVSTETLSIVTAYVEVCRDLLSRHNPHALPFFDHINQSVIHYASFLFQNRIHAKFHDNLYLLILIQIKIVKLICVYQYENASKFIIKLLDTHGTNLVEIICDCVIQNGYIWKKACEMWFKIFSLLDIKGLEDRTEEIRRGTYCCFASSIVDKLHQFGVCMLFPGDIRSGNGKQPRLGFTGCELPTFLETAEIKPDCVRLVEGCRLTLKACECIVVKPGGGTEASLSHKNSYTVLSSLDSFMKDVVSCDISVPFHWLPQVFGDQDDSWIEALLMLLNITTQGQLPDHDPPVCLQPHHFFHQFVAATGYDHSVLVDLLTSPETCFLTYFTKYLKYSLSTWDDLVKEYKYCLSPHQAVLSKTEESDMVMVRDSGIKRDNDRVCKDSTNLLKTGGLSVKHCNAKYVKNIYKAEVEENMKFYMNAVHNQCNSEAENRSNGNAYDLHDNQTLRTGSNQDDKELLNTDKTRGDNVLTESVDLCNINGFSNEKLKSCVGEHIDSEVEILKVKDQTSHNCGIKASESSYGEVESKIYAQVLEDHKSCMCVTDKSRTFIQCSGKRSACNVKDSNISPDLKKKCIIPQKKQNFFMEKESVNIETGNEELSPKCEQYSCLESVEFVEEIQSQETCRLLAGTDKESVLIKEGENGDMVSIQRFSQHADRENDTLRAAEYLQTNGMLRKNPNLCSTITNFNVRKGSESRQKHNQSFLTNVSNKGNVGKTNEEYMLDSNNSPVQTKEDYAAISNDLDSVEVWEEEKSKETQKLEGGQCNKESLLLTEGEELESMTFENVVCTGKTEICKTDEKRVIELENFKTQTDMATEIDKELENIEFQECYSMKDITEFKLVNYEIDDSDSLSDSGVLDSSIEVEDVHNAIDSEPSKNSEIQIDGIDYDITVSERISSSPGLVDYVMSDEDEIMILNELKSDINKSSFLERSSEYKTSFENNSGNKSLDTLMGVFIRVRMKTEKLKSANILQYNPQPLLRLLHALEDKYESF